MAATIRDVAQAAGVSPSTVSRALSVPDLVSPATRARVETVVRRLGYEPNRAARGLITGRTGNIGLIVPDLSNPFFSAAAKGVQAAARAGRPLGLRRRHRRGGRRRAGAAAGALQAGRRHRAVLAPAPSAEVLDEIGPDTPIVLFNRRVEGRPAVTVDAADGMRQAVGHLGALGHRRIAFVGGPRLSWSNGERQRGLRLAAQDAGIELEHLGHFPPQFHGGVAAADLVIASGATAVIGYNDLTALGLLSRSGRPRGRGPRADQRARFRRHPDVGHDPPGAVHDQRPTVEAGRACVALLFSMIAGEHATVPVRELPTQLIVRATTGVAPAPERKGTSR